MIDEIKVKLFDSIVDAVGEGEDIHRTVIKIQDIFGESESWENEKIGIKHQFEVLEYRSQSQIKMINKLTGLLNEFASYSYKNRDRIRRAGFDLDDYNKIKI